MGACDRAQIENLTFHDLRHEAGSRKLEAGWPLHAVSRWLGHSRLTTTDTYLNATTPLLHELNERRPLALLKSTLGEGLLRREATVGSNLEVLEPEA